MIYPACIFNLYGPNSPCLRGTMLSSLIKCAASNEECPCGDNTVKCPLAAMNIIAVIANHMA